MPNVNSCSKLCEEYMVNPSVFDRISEIPDSQNIVAFRGKTNEEKETLLTKWRDTVVGTVQERYGDVDLKLGSNNNRVGADLYFEHDNQQINVELKFGNETNSNIGMRTFHKIVGETVFPYIPSKERTDWLYAVHNNEKDMSDWIAYKNDYLNEQITRFNEKYADMPVDNSEFLMKKIINNSGSCDSNDGNYIKFVLKNGDMREKSDISNGRLYFKKIEPLDVDHTRLNVFITDNEGLSIKFTLNWKNNVHKKDIFVESKYGFGSPSFNCFVTQR